MPICPICSKVFTTLTSHIKLKHTRYECYINADRVSGVVIEHIGDDITTYDNATVRVINYINHNTDYFINYDYVRKDKECTKKITISYDKDKIIIRILSTISVPYISDNQTKIVSSEFLKAKDVDIIINQ